MVIEVTVSAPTEEDAEQLSRRLLEQELVAGTRITVGTSHYKWEGEIEENTYWNINAYTVSERKGDIIESVERVHPDDCPIITFSTVDGNENFVQWVNESLNNFSDSTDLL